MAGCFSLDPFLFSGKPLDKYRFDAYAGERECADAIDTVKALEAAGSAPAAADSSIFQYTVASGNGSITAVLISARRPPLTARDTVIVFFRGKGPHIDFYWPRTRLLHAAGFPVVIPDYRGFGMSPGKPTEASISEDGRALITFLADSLGGPRVLVYGYSLGSLVACDLLANNAYPQVTGLVLEAPIGSIATLVENASFLDLPASYLTTYTGNNIERIASIHVPLLWIHGTLDETNERETQGVPLWNNYSGDGYYIKSIGARHATNPQTLGYGRYIASLKAFFRGRAKADFPSILDGNHHIEWGCKF